MLTLTGVRVLAVDDDLDNLELMSFILQEAGAIVTAVSSATDVLQALTQITPDILLTDIGMPHMDGYGLLHQIRSQPAQGRQIPAIALTAYAGEVDRQRALAAGFQTHISKPVEPEKLVAAIATLIDESRS